MDKKAIDQLDCMIFLSVFLLTTWLFRMIMIDISSALEVLPVLLEQKRRVCHWL